MTNSTTNTGPSLHPFEKAGLGKAPFKFIGMTHEVGPIRLADGMTTIGAPGQPMGSCDYCGQGIALVCRVKSSDGNVFKVGCDCVNKVYKDYGRESADPIKRAIDRAKKEHQRKVRHAREQRKLAEYREWTDANREALEATPNPQREGESRWDQVEWFQRHAGTSGNLKLFKTLKAVLEG